MIVATEKPPLPPHSGSLSAPCPLKSLIQLVDRFFERHRFTRERDPPGTAIAARRTLFCNCGVRRGVDYSTMPPPLPT